MTTHLFSGSKSGVRLIAFKPLFLIPIFYYSLNVAISMPCNQAKSIQSDTAEKRLIIKYHKNGNVKERGYQGYYSNKFISTGTYFGTWNTYNQNGQLIKTLYYHNDIPSKAFIEKKEFYLNGRIKSIEKFNNYELYESEIDSIGTWRYYNTRGKLIKRINHDKGKMDHNN